MSTHRFLAAVLASLLLLAGCSSAEDAADDPSEVEAADAEATDSMTEEAMTEEAMTEDAMTEEAVTEGAMEDEASEPASAAAPDATESASAEEPVVDDMTEGGSAPDLPDVEVTEEFCTEVASIVDTVTTAGDGPDEIEASFAAIDEAFARALEQAPDGAVETLEGAQAFFAGVNDAAAAVDYDESQVGDEVFADLEAAHGEDVQNMEAYFAACELDI